MNLMQGDDPDDIFRRLLKIRDYALYSRMYEVKYTCQVPKSTTVHPIERDMFIDPVFSVNDNTGYGYLGEDLEDFSTDVTDTVDNMFSSFEEEISDTDFGLKNKSDARITIYEMAKLYDDGNFVYVDNGKHLKEVYGILEAFVSYRIEYYEGPNSGNIDADSDLAIIDALATSIASIYKDVDGEIYYENKGSKRSGHLTYRPGVNEDKKVIRTGRKVVPKVSNDRLKQLGLDLD